ncbi:MAG: hypothetical protein RSC08_06840 [Oscillospiraceae bacterium]
MPATHTAYAAPQTLLIDGKEVKFNAYALKDAAGNMTNYFQVRDVALALNGTAAQFNVVWNGYVDLRDGAAYTPTGTEMAAPFTGNQPCTQVLNTIESEVPDSFVFLDYITLTDAKGNGYTYYNLRNLGEDLGFKVDWNGKNVTIDTTAAFSAYST